MSNIRYRKDIDGLRAFAVLAVVLFHLNISWIKSGFLGVDIFFVISGFLITSIIIRDLQNNSFSIKNFYLRRIRRILPALIVVLIFSSFLAWIILLPQDLHNYAESLVSAIASVSNIFFLLKLNFSYFGQDSQIIPLIHTWSLGVEEQFYLIWPLVLIILFKLGLSSKRKLFFVSLSFLIISVMVFLSGELNIYIVSSERWYYFPLHRAFELLFGCCLAILLNKGTLTINNKLLLNILSIASLILMVIPIFCIKVLFPSFWTIIACLGATLFIYCGSNNYIPIVNKIFSIKPMVAIGLISYSLYLWHWPIIAYVNYISLAKTPSLSAIIFILSIILATLSYFFIEKPFRHKYKFSLKKSILYFWLLPLILAIGFCLGSTNYKFGYKHPSIDQNYLTYSYGFEKIDQNNCFLMIQSSDFESKQLPDVAKCSIGAKTSSAPQILLVGDSHARSEIPMLAVWLKNINQNAYAVTQKTTPFLYDFNKNIELVSTTDRNNAIKNLIKTQKYKYVILSGEWSNPIYSSSIASIQKSIKLIIDNKGIPILILDTPQLRSDITNLCTLEQDKLPFLFKKHDCQLDMKTVQAQQFKFSKLVIKLKKEFPQLVVIDPKKVLCDKESCDIQINHIPIYADSNHLNYIGSKLLGKKYMQEYGNPLNFIKT